MLKKILKFLLAFLARRTIAKYKPLVIGVTGSVGKTSTRLAIAALLDGQYRLRTAEKNYNNDIGLPLTVLGIKHCGRNIFRWAAALAGAGRRLVMRESGYPETLILEYGVDRPGDMRYLLSMARPQIAIVTAIGAIPAHVEFFRDGEALVGEKADMVRALGPQGTAILDHDDASVAALRDVTEGRVVTYGFDKRSDLRIVYCAPRVTHHPSAGDVPDGINIKIQYKGTIAPLRLDSCFGFPHAISAAAAAATGIALGMNLVDISTALRRYIPPPGRLRVIEGVRQSVILDDTYNAAPESVQAALDTLLMLPGKRKIAVLGDMLELGRFGAHAHRAVGRRAAQCTDILVTVGAAARTIANEAVAQDVARDSATLPFDRVFKFDDAISAGKALRRMIQRGDLVLVKGSQAMRMERVVEEVMAHREDAGELLVRQEPEWKKK